MLGWPLSAGWSHLIDSSPNYGTNGKAFAQRLGAAAALNSSKEIFSDSILATAFHQDPRYYQLGRSHKLINRAVYAGTRPIIGRTDSGKTIPNYAFILGQAALLRLRWPIILIAMYLDPSSLEPGPALLAALPSVISSASSEERSFKSSASTDEIILLSQGFDPSGGKIW